MGLIDFIDDYIDTKLNNDKWLALSDSDKEKYCLEVERQVLSIYGIQIKAPYPDDVKVAMAEIALNMVNAGDEAQFAKLQKSGVASISYGNDSVSFASNSAFYQDNIYLSDYAKSLLAPYIIRSCKVV